MKKRTVYQLIIDRSGSMHGSENQVISGYNEQLISIQAVQRNFPNQELIMALRFFDHNVDPNITDYQPVDQIKPIEISDYQLGGSTALLDAIGKSIYDVKTRFGYEIENHDTTIVFIIITDGHENASKYYTYQDIHRMVRDLEATSNWSFTFMGADLDAISASQRMGINPDNTLSFDKCDYVEVNRRYFDKAANSYAESKENNIPVTNFFSIFKQKDIRKKK